MIRAIFIAGLVGLGMWITSSASAQSNPFDGPQDELTLEHVIKYLDKRFPAWKREVVDEALEQMRAEMRQLEARMAIADTGGVSVEQQTVMGVVDFHLKRKGTVHMGCSKGHPIFLTSTGRDIIFKREDVEKSDAKNEFTYCYSN